MSLSISLRSFSGVSAPSAETATLKNRQVVKVELKVRRVAHVAWQLSAGWH